MYNLCTTSVHLYILCTFCKLGIRVLNTSHIYIYILYIDTLCIHCIYSFAKIFYAFPVHSICVLYTSHKNLIYIIWKSYIEHIHVFDVGHFCDMARASLGRVEEIQKGLRVLWLMI